MRSRVWDVIAILFTFIFPPLGLLFGFIALKRGREKAISIIAMILSGIFIFVYSLFFIPLFSGEVDDNFVLTSCELYCNVHEAESLMGKDFTIELSKYGIESCEDFVLEYYPEKFEDFEVNCHRDEETGVYEQIQEVVDEELVEGKVL